jgi:hypothetical protein
MFHVVRSPIWGCQGMIVVRTLITLTGVNVNNLISYKGLAIITLRENYGIVSISFIQPYR